MPKQPSDAVLKDIHLRMVRIRAFEEEAGKLMENGKIPGALHLYVGQEAVAAGVMVHLSDDDQITSTHRGHGHLVAKGGEFKQMYAELFGRATGYCKGKGGSMHISNLDLGMLGANGIVGAGPPIAVGAAFTQQVPRHAQRRGHLLRRRRQQRRRLPRGGQHGRALQAARSSSCARTTATASSPPRRTTRRSTTSPIAPRATACPA